MKGVKKGFFINEKGKYKTLSKNPNHHPHLSDKQAKVSDDYNCAQDMRAGTSVRR